MSQSDDLLAAVVANPDDDGPRLVMADWYDEHGEPERAEFIRVQIALAKIDEYEPDYQLLSDREKTLIREHGHRWKIPDLKGVQDFRRGFVESVWLQGDHLLTESKRIENVPTVRRLRVSVADRRMNDLAKLPWISRLCELDLTNNSLVRFLLPDLFEDVDCSGIKSLVLRNVRLWAEELETLIQHPGFPGLDHFDLSGNPLGDDGLAHIAEGPILHSLHSLIFRSDGLDESESVHEIGMRALAASTTMVNLQHLDLSGHNPGGQGLIAIANSPIIRRVTKLSLAAKGYAKDEPEWVHEFLASQSFEHLRVLIMNGKLSHAMDAEAFANWSRLASGTILDFRHLRLEDNEIEQLKVSPYSNQIWLDPVEQQ